MSIVRFLAALLLLCIAAPAPAYWEYGHKTVAKVAMASVQPQTRAEIRRLLRQGVLLQTPECPVATLEEASIWADCIKPLGDRFSYMSSWHYQNADICKPFDLKAACRDGNCVSAQIERNARLLADRTLPPRERLIALVLLVHFVGDLAQPMHAGDRGDRGGNDVAASYGIIAGRANLHSIWDGWLPERAVTTPPAGARGLLGELRPEQRRQLAAGTVEEWSRESWQAARDFAYATMLPDPCGPKPAERPVLTEAEVRQLIPPVRRQVAAGGLRLAKLLDDALLRGLAPNQRERR